ncbi:major facilitator superfamily transporter [Fusarium albosuccineum]|uniref:Major facilitator superfamily transporter n=1 Tax=Fusarium albosuccineum TaxID=1237068 RepID=A0A8H4KZR1_9HYPO|nr:major facilitator superfamily transporter [Fusarium albosuccineum]
MPFQNSKKNSHEVHDPKKDAESMTGVAEAEITYTPAQEERIKKKIDRHLLPVLAIMYLVSYLDRSNMGNAAIIGLKEDLNLTPGQLMGLVQGFSGLLAARFFLAIGESGFFPAASYILTMWYRRHEIQLRAGIFYSAGALSGAVSGLLAYLINKMDGVAGLEGWRWVFILEGMLTVVIAVSAFFVLPDDPATCSFLTEEEKAIVDHRLKYDVGTHHGSFDAHEPFKWKHVWSALLDYKVWAVVVVYWGSAIPIYGFIYTLPTVLKELGYTAEIAQLMTIPIYVAAVVALLLTAHFSDKAGDRSMFVIVPLLVGGVGLIGLLAIPKRGVAPGALLDMLFLVAMGLYSIVCGTVAWTANNLAGPWKRSVGMALMIAVGNLGGAAGTNIYLARESPHDWTGYGTSLGVIVLSLASSLFLRYKFKSINAKRDAMTLEEIREKYTEEELRDMGDDSPLFRYTI